MVIKRRLGRVKIKPKPIGKPGKPELVKKLDDRKAQLVANVNAAFIAKYNSLASKPLTYGMRIRMSLEHALFDSSIEELDRIKRIEAENFIGNDIKTY